MDQYMLRYFLAVAELGNFSRAAERMAVTQPTLSAGIAKLEAQLGARLFDRNRRRVQMTQAGSRFLLHARRITAEIDLAVQDVKHLPDPQLLRVGLLSTISNSIIERLVTMHRRGGFNEVLEFLDGTERDLIDRLDRGRLDIVITVIRQNHERFCPELLRRERYVLVLPLDHALADTEFLRAEDLAGERMVVRRHCEGLPEISRFFAQHGVRPHFALKTSSDERMLAIVRAGQGIGMMAECVSDAAVRVVRLIDFYLQRDVGILYGPTIASSSRHRNSPFVKLLREEYTRG
jgi:DNA-binding transcriptional LysR family regulator